MRHPESSRHPESGAQKAAATGGQRSLEDLHIEFRARSEELQRVRTRLRAWLTGTSLGPDRAYDLLLAVNEACSNSVEHGHRGDGRTVVLHASVAHAIRITVSDSGTWRAPRADEEVDRGRGLPMMNALMPGTRVVSGADGTTVEFVASLTAESRSDPDTGQWSRRTSADQQ
ncbi:ATP-binding protein [Nocardia africana]|uniref:Anti-sigma F factor n=1 Tax=Nocardia africana TaxID=134964 RepID=A0A378WXD9_9NOCA|nr:ATP-binding protein [Nocardia africana]MCC3313508.1 ATP-binding protein [Nocardia africana]SUA45121.1 anti-sigma F factor [Nocardia africana]